MCVFNLSEYKNALKLFTAAEYAFASENNTEFAFTCLNYKAELLLILNNPTEAISELSDSLPSIIKIFGSSNSITIKSYEILGKLYSAINDINYGRKYYDLAIENSKNIYGDIDARTGNLYRHISAFYQFYRNYDSAYYYGRKAMLICSSDSIHQKEVPFEEVYIEYGIALKNTALKVSRTDFQILDSATNIFRFAAKLAHQKYSKGSWQEAWAIHQLANTFTDKVYRLKNTENKYRQLCYNSARYYYSIDLAMKKRLLGFHSTETSLTFYTLALLEHFYFRSSWNDQILSYYDMAIAAITPGYDTLDASALPKLQNSTDLYLLSTLLGMKASFIKDRLQKKENIKYLDYYYKIEKLRISIWDKLILEFRSTDVNKLIGLWNTDIFLDMLWACNEKYRLTKDEKYFEEAFLTFEKSKNSMFIKSILQSGLLITTDFENERKKLASYRAYSVPEIRSQLLDDSTALIEYYTSTSEQGYASFVFILSKSDMYLLPLKYGTETDSMIQEFQKGLQNFNAQEYCNISNNLYHKLLEPALNTLPSSIHSLIISPSGMLQRIPFEALAINKKSGNNFSKIDYLNNHYSISYALSGTINLINKKRPPAEKGLIFACSPSFSKKANLPFSTKLIHSLSNKYEGRFYFGDDASKELLKEFSSYSIVHLATHAEIKIDNSDSSRIYFSEQSQNSVSWLYQYEIYPLHLNSDLTIVSACETGLGEQKYGEGTASFTRAFSYAGCRSTMTTLWKVDDKTSSEVLSLFYNCLDEGLKTAEALQKAKKQFLYKNNNSGLASPFYWSGIVLTGYSTSIQTSKKPVRYYTYGVILAAVSIVFVVIKKIRKS